MWPFTFFFTLKKYDNNKKHNKFSKSNDLHDNEASKMLELSWKMESKCCIIMCKYLLPHLMLFLSFLERSFSLLFKGKGKKICFLNLQNSWILSIVNWLTSFEWTHISLELCYIYKAFQNVSKFLLVKYSELWIWFFLLFENRF